MNAKRICKKHIGRPMDFMGCNRHEGVVCHGRIVSVNNGIAKLEDCLFPGDGSGYTVLLEVRSPKIVEIY